MEQKILEGLKKAYTNLGLSDKVLEMQAKMLATTIPADTAEEELEGKIQEAVDSVKDMLTAIQSFGDQRAAKGNKGDKPQEKKEEPKDELSAQMKELLDQLKASNDRIAALEGQKTKDEYDTLVKKIAKELGISGKRLDYAKALHLSEGMTEKEIRDGLGAAKKDFVKMGLPTEEAPEDKATQEQQMRADEEKWIEQFKAQQDNK